MAVELFVISYIYLLMTVSATQEDIGLVRPCDNPVYCYGDLLRDVQITFKLFRDSKQFVDMPMKDSPSNILHAYKNLTNITKEILRDFILEWFDPPGSDLLPWEPPDWTESPQFIDSIGDENYRQWAMDLNTLWKSFGKQLNKSVALYPSRHSLLLVQNPFIAAGADGRFLEYYYWDSFWIIRGLLLCEMYETTKGMIKNLAGLIDKYGLVPNGGRQYYTKRSQPPLLTWMVYSYFSVTNDTLFVKEMLPLLDREYEFWMTNRTTFVSDCNCTVNYYASPVTAPRPESYREDVVTANQVSEELRPQLYSNLASGAESGWDFSSRWLSSNGSVDDGQLTSITTKSIIPVDLNAILGANEILLQKLHFINGSLTAANNYATAWTRRKTLLNTFFWSEKDSLYKDFSVENSQHTTEYYSSSIVPLYTFSLTSEGLNISRAKLIVNQLRLLGVLTYPGGLPASLNASGQQWDFPNVWAPLQWLLVKGLEEAKDKELKRIGRDVALSWLRSTYQAWTKYNQSMFEKYDCTVFGEPGGGGEYTLQSGFGWTNGAVLDLLSTHALTTLDSSPQSSRSPFLWLLFLIPILLIIILTLFCICCCRYIYVQGKAQYWARIRHEQLLNSSQSSEVVSPASPITHIYSNQDAIDEADDEKGIDIITYRLSDV